MEGTIIGIDTHISRCDHFAIDSKSGKVLEATNFVTNTTNMIANVTKYPRPRIVVIEQGPMSEWIERILGHHVSCVVVADPKQNNWIAKDRNKNDRIDAEKLARLYIGGFIKEIKSRSKEKSEFISLVIHYHSLIEQMVRVKNQISAKFRQCGKRKKGSGQYRSELISLELKMLDGNGGVKKAIENYSKQLVLLEEQKEEIKARLYRYSKKYKEVDFLQEFAGVGFVGAFTLAALVDIPERFSSEKKIWIYCGYGLDRQSSGNNLGRPRITQRSNRLLKDVIMTAVHNIIQVDKTSDYKKWYLNEIALGKDPCKVRARLARKLIKDIWVKWRRFNEVNNLKKAA